MNQIVILLADDDRDDTEMFCEALESIDTRIVCHYTANGALLLRKLDELDELPDLIFLDMNMPVMNGLDCLAFLKSDKRYQHIPVIMISTSSHQKEMNMAISQGALCYFVKPHKFNELIEVLRAITSNLGPGLRDAIVNLQTTGFGHIFTCH